MERGDSYSPSPPGERVGVRGWSIALDTIVMARVEDGNASPSPHPALEGPALARRSAGLSPRGEAFLTLPLLLIH